VRRGDLVTVAIRGDYGKPRPALVIQSDLIDTTSSITVLLLTSTLAASPMVRHTLEPSDLTGLRTTSQVQIDKIFTVDRAKVGPPIGRLDEETMATITRNLALFLGIA
jgi:mRNA interferase MazF